MSDSFIDGLQTRSEKVRLAQVHTTTIASGDPFATRTRRVNQPRQAIQPLSRSSSRSELRDQKQAAKIHTKLSDSSDFLELRGNKFSENEYRRKVLGFSDDEIDLSLDYDDLKKSRRKKSEKAHKKSKKRRGHFKRNFALAVLTLFIAAGGVAYFWGDSIIAKMTGGNAGLIDLIRSAILSDGNAKFNTGRDGRTNILLFGTSGYDMAGKTGKGVHDGAQLTDSIMVLSLEQNTGDVAMVSIQRDLLVGTCTATGKINEVYYCANPNGDNEQAGAKALEEEVSDVLGMDMQYYVHINWGSLVSIVDALGGVTVTLDEDIDDPDWTGTRIKAGVPVMLNGEQALGLARARHGTDGGDFTRTNSQQKLLIALKDRVLERGLSLTELLNLATVMGDNFRTDFSADEIAAGAKLATTADFASMRQISLMDTDQGKLLTTGTLGGVSYVLPSSGEYNYGNLRKYISTRLDDKPESAANILVLNGSGEAGIAAVERDELQKSGFKVAKIGDAPAGEYFEKYTVYALSDKPQTKEKLEKYYNVSALSREELPAAIDVNNIDFVVILGVGYN